VSKPELILTTTASLKFGEQSNTKRVRHPILKNSELIQVECYYFDVYLQQPVPKKTKKKPKGVE